ncbi:mechanosensitive ion channel [Taibaiella lutea]|uniref:Mechanosensitive ion channel n=1 Tax=Taibaiella lutea TaxID=2608001 RepID=A0A5M6CHY5_9BACT|nr:mechanosensitive ion channel domain-containing protein [Taibaiella lutea]KAA5534821.1 mechanosensitive ion channel [Taibaiella lutea]
MEELNQLLKGNIVNIGKLVITGWDIIMIVLIIIGTKLMLFFIRRWISRYNIRRNRNVWDGNTNAIFQLIKYFIWVLTIVVVLDVVNINLSFLLAGSAALLVGIGFGLQQIFQDIISGIFILIERKVKIGDVMEVDQFIGRITEIGIRTSTIVTRDGTSIIVPNHKFINDNVLNWSHADALMRFKISIGVAYGSDVGLVAALLQEAAIEHTDIFEDKDHPNIVRLVEFADSSLKFDLLFWTTQKFNVENLKSELRFAVLKKLNENNIEIPFPQRDLNLKTGFQSEMVK